jgi:hypothetical protein
MSEVQTPRLQVVDRTQLLLRPVVVEELIPDDHPGARNQGVCRSAGPQVKTAPYLNSLPGLNKC